MNALFETERLLVRPFTLDDADDFFRLYGDPEVMRFIRPAKTREECDVYLREAVAWMQEHPLMGRWLAWDKHLKEMVGSLGVLPVEKSDKVQFGYAFLKEHWGKGYATEAAHGGVRFFFNASKHNILYAYTEPANTGSQSVLLKAGFVRYGMAVLEEKEVDEFILKREWL
jgi:ribosomal-protein-alanine N-acetyltransferase